METSARYKACRMLRQNGIGCLAWFEDALGAYGVNTVPFDLYIVVPNIVDAADILLSQGWNPYPPRKEDYYSFLWGFDDQTYRRLLPVDWISDSDFIAQSTHTREDLDNKQPIAILLPASFWGLTDDDLPQHGSILPSLPVIANAMIARFLDSESDSRMEKHLGHQIIMMYTWVDEIKQLSFATNLSQEYRQFHLDAIRGEDIVTIPGAKLQRQKRAALARQPPTTNGGTNPEHSTQTQQSRHSPPPTMTADHKQGRARPCPPTTNGAANPGHSAETQQSRHIPPPNTTIMAQQSSMINTV